MPIFIIILFCFIIHALNFPQYFSNSFYSLFLSVVVKTLDVSLSEAVYLDTISCSATLLYYTGFIVKVESYVKMRASMRERQTFIPSPPPTNRCGCPPYFGCYNSTTVSIGCWFLLTILISFECIPRCDIVESYRVLHLILGRIFMLFSIVIEAFCFLT